MKNYDITIAQGATWQKAFRYSTVTVDGSGTKVKTPVNLTGWTAKGQIRRWQNKTSELLAEMAFVTLTNDGYVKASLSATVTDAIAGNAFYDIELTGPGVVVRLVQGKVTIDKAVTA